jgi:CheY-like chemotaxis protein
MGNTPYIKVTMIAGVGRYCTKMFDDPTVLLAEDDADDVLITQIAFRKARLANHLEIVRDGEEAIAYIKGGGRYADRKRYPFPMLLLLDLHMPKVDGFEVLEWLRKRPELAHLPVAVLTSSDHDPDATRAFELGADSYLIKPPDAVTLMELVQRLHAFWLIVNERGNLQAA